MIKPQFRPRPDPLMAAFSICALTLSSCLPDAGAQVRETARSRMAREKVQPVLVEALREKGLGWGAPIYMRVFKDSAELEVWVHKPADARYVLFRTYKICAFSGNCRVICWRQTRLHGPR